MPPLLAMHDRDRRTRSPGLISVWSGCHAASLSVAAFTLLAHWQGDAMAAFGTISVTGMACRVAGGRAARAMTRRHAPARRLVLLLGLAALTSGAVAACGEAVAAHILATGGPGEALLLAGLLFAPPLLLLSMLPVHAAAMRARRRGPAGSTPHSGPLGPAIGYGIGIVATVQGLADWRHAWTVFGILAGLSLLLTILAYFRCPRGR